jgi:hypothetical protein
VPTGRTTGPDQATATSLVSVGCGLTSPWTRAEGSEQRHVPHHGPGTCPGHGVTVHRGHVAPRDRDESGQRRREGGSHHLRERDIHRTQDMGNAARNAAGLFPGQVPGPVTTWLRSFTVGLSSL